TVFVRLTGCPLRCQYCDSEYAFHGGERMTIEGILEQIAQYSCKTICVTGGEPLAQPNALILMTQLCELGYQVSLETSGAMDVASVDPRVSIVMDLKTPDSAEVEKNLYGNIQHLRKKDQLKFVVCSRRDFDWALFKIDEYSLSDKVGELLISPSFGQVEPAELADWVITSGAPVRFQLQLHKILWGDKPGV
ncbi:MAG: 7-carboxy-7-deazaguanine synthase, partial [Flavobacteriales bacterium]